MRFRRRVAEFGLTMERGTVALTFRGFVTIEQIMNKTIKKKFVRRLTNLYQHVRRFLTN